jgi:hypothetical protein
MGGMTTKKRGSKRASLKEVEGVYTINLTVDVHAYSQNDAVIQITDLLETGTHEGGAENAVVDFELRSLPRLTRR